jgi:isoamylase
VLALRTRQIKNLLAINVLALGTPMLLMGDEMRRSQQGNNNAFCQDNATSWLDWTLLERHADIHRFVRGLIRLRGQRTLLDGDPRLTLKDLLARAKVQVHGVRLGAPDMSAQSHSLAISACSMSSSLQMHFALNAYWEALDFELPLLPVAPARGWRRLLDTARSDAQDLLEFEAAPPAAGGLQRVEARSVVMWLAKG